MTQVSVTLLASVLFAFATTGNSQAISSTDELVPPRQIDPLWITVPPEIEHLIDEEAIAKVAIRLDEEGIVADWVPLQLPHYKLWSSVENAMPYLKLSPALLNGSPILVDMVIEIPIGKVHYYGVITLDPRIYLETVISKMVPDKYQMVVTDAGELDEPLQLLSKGKTVIPVDSSGEHLKGEVMVEFFIDINGKPRMLDSDDSLDPVVRNAAHMTVSQFSFNKPTHNGRPTVTKAKIRIHY